MCECVCICVCESARACLGTCACIVFLCISVCVKQVHSMLCYDRMVLKGFSKHMKTWEHRIIASSSSCGCAAMRVVCVYIDRYVYVCDIISRGNLSVVIYVEVH